MTDRLLSPLASLNENAVAVVTYLTAQFGPVLGVLAEAPREGGLVSIGGGLIGLAILWLKYRYGDRQAAIEAEQLRVRIEAQRLEIERLRAELRPARCDDCPEDKPKP